MDNGILQVTISSPDGIVTGIRYNGIDNVLEVQDEEVERGYWDLVWSKTGSTGTTGTFDVFKGTSFKVVVENEDQVEISFTRTWDFSLEGNVVPLNLDKRFIMLRNSSGFYSYAIFEHLGEWPPFNLPQVRIVFKLRKDKFHYMAVADNRQRFMPLPDDRLPDRGQPLATPEAVLLVNPVEPEFRGEVRINDPKADPPLFTTGQIGHDNTIARHGIHGLYRLYNVDVPGVQLVEGENIIFLTQAINTDPLQAKADWLEKCTFFSTCFASSASVVMDNGNLQVTISKPEGIVTGVSYQGIDNLLEVRNEESDRGFIVLRGSSGFYSYAIFEHLKEWPGFNLPQTRIVFKLRKDKFRYMAVADNRQRRMPLPEDRSPRRSRPLAYPEAALLVHPVEPEFKGEVHPFSFSL
ncbi:hypothetical protein POUND7_018030 [Theobroma cacao]